MSGPVLLQGAMDAETDWLAAQLECAEETCLAGYRFWRGMVRGRALVVCRTEVGLVNAACATALGIREFAPSVVINQGIAGGHTEDLHVGDIVVGASSVNINSYETMPLKRGEGSAPFSWSAGEMPDPIEADPVWTARFAAAPYGDGKKAVGRLGCGDVFSREHDRILWLRERWDHLCEDMESVAVYQTCARFGVPCAGVRILSNNELTAETYDRTMGLRLQRFILAAVCAE